jgi:molybdopterin synthase sulfur carrier subunit
VCWLSRVVNLGIGKSMINVILFASIRENLGTQGLQVSVPQPLSVTALVQHLGQTENDQWRQELGQENVLVAVNQAMVSFDHVVQDDDEVAFFPPVTGG